MIKKKPEQILKLAVKRMLPQGPLAKKQLSKLKMYKGKPHQTQSYLNYRRYQTRVLSILTVFI
jgi:large subunit ribosomal protein L13